MVINAKPQPYVCLCWFGVCFFAEGLVLFKRVEGLGGKRRKNEAAGWEGRMIRACLELPVTLGTDRVCGQKEVSPAQAVLMDPSGRMVSTQQLARAAALAGCCAAPTTVRTSAFTQTELSKGRNSCAGSSGQCLDFPWGVDEWQTCLQKVHSGGGHLAAGD